MVISLPAPSLPQQQRHHTHRHRPPPQSTLHLTSISTVALVSSFLIKRKYFTGHCTHVAQWMPLLDRVTYKNCSTLSLREFNALCANTCIHLDAVSFLTQRLHHPCSNYHSYYTLHTQLLVCMCHCEAWRTAEIRIWLGTQVWGAGVMCSAVFTTVWRRLDWIRPPGKAV